MRAILRRMRGASPAAVILSLVAVAAIGATTTLTLGTNTGPGGVIKLFGSTSGDLTLQPPAAAGTATVFQFPPDNGTADFVARTDGSGVVTWVAVPPATTGSGTTHSLAAAKVREYWYCTGTCTVTPPVPAAGYEFCVANNVAVTSVITMAALGSSARYGKTDQSAYGTAGTGTMVSGGAAGDKVCLIGLDSTHYNVGSYAGSWTNN